VLTLGVALFFWTLFRRGPWTTARRAAFLGLCLCLCLWSKLTTLGPAHRFFSAAAGSSPMPGPSDAFAPDAGRGALLFLATWGLYCFWLQGRAGGSTAAYFWEPFAYLTGSGAAERAWTAGLSQWALYEFSFAAYAGVLLLALAAVQVGRWAARVWSLAGFRSARSCPCSPWPAWDSTAFFWEEAGPIRILPDALDFGGGPRV